MASTESAAASSSLSSPALALGGSTLNLDLCNGAVDVLRRLRTVHKSAIKQVSLEYNLMAELVFDREWMDIFNELGSLPNIHTITLGFRIPVPLPIQALIQLMRLATPLNTLNLSGLQLSTTSNSNKAKKDASSCSACIKQGEENVVHSMANVFRNHTSLKKIHVCRYRPIIKPTNQQDSLGLDPLLYAISKLPNLSVLHLERTDIFSNSPILQLVCCSPMQTLKIGALERNIRLEDYVPHMVDSINSNGRLRELIIQHQLHDKALEALARLLYDNTSLEKVSLLRIASDNFGSRLAVALTNNTTLQSLELNVLTRDRTRFRKTLVDLAASLTNSNLLTLKLDAKGVPTSGSSLMTEPFLQILKDRNFMLRELIINRNRTPLRPEIQFYLKLNRLGRHLLLRKNQSASEVGLVPATSSGENESDDERHQQWALMLIQNRRDVRVLHYFISRNPLVLPQT